MKEIVTALAKAMSEVTRLAKDNKNLEQKYSFASVDDFLAMTGPIMAQNGLVVVMNETEVGEFERQGKYGVSHWLRIKFAVHVLHVSGEVLAPVTRSVEVIRTGAQSFGAAQSYVLKQHLRALLQIPTGDGDDPDAAGKGEGQPVRRQVGAAINEAREDAVLDRLPPPASPRQTAEAFAERIIADFNGKGQKALDNAWGAWKAHIDRLETNHPDLHEKVVDAYEMRNNELTPDPPRME